MASQAESWATPEALQSSIEERAINHANAGEQMYHDSVYEEFKDNSLGWDRLEILDVYEAKFTEERERLKSDLKEFLPLNWLTGGILLLLGALLTYIRDRVSAGVEAIGNWLYRRVSGNPLLRNLALQKYRNYLKEHLKHLDTPFKIEPPLEMAAVYVPLKVKEWSEAPNHPTDATDIYQALSQQKGLKRLMVTGPPGSGKSVLLKHIAFTYGNDALDLPDNPIPVRLELNTLTGPDLDEVRFVKRLVKVLEDSNFPNAKNFVAQGLQKGKLLLLLDGLDEVSSQVRPQVVRVINEVLRKYTCPAVVTCRTAVYNHEFDLVLNRNRLEVDEFSDRQIRQFLQAWDARMPPEKSVEQLMQELQNRPKIKILAQNPLLLTIIAGLYTEARFILPYSRTKFYQRATGFLLEQRDQEHNIPNQYPMRDKWSVLRKLALAIQDTLDPNNPDRRNIPYTTVLSLINQTLPVLSPKTDDADSILEEIVSRSGLLQKVVMDDGDECYRFAHLTLQEFFAAKALISEDDALVTRFQQDPTAWREVVKLWCGMAKNSTQLIQQVYEQDALTAFECLADAQTVEQDLADQIVTHMMQDLYRATTDDTVARAFGTVAADSRPQSQGQKVFALLSQRLETEAGDVFKAAAVSLSMTNLPQAAEVLATQYRQDPPAISEALIRMGDVAVPDLARLAQSDDLEAVAALHKIATPEAAKALIPLLWRPEPALQTSAAWRLATLLPRFGIEAALKTYDLSAAIKTDDSIQTPEQAQSLSWVWLPFEESGSSAMPVIAGRIAAILSVLLAEIHSRLLDSEDWKEVADPRIIIPLCAIHLRPTGSIGRTPTNKEELKILVDRGFDQAKFKNTAFGKMAVVVRESRNSFWGIQLSTESQEILDKLIGNTRSNDAGSNNERIKRWLILLSGVKRNLQAELLYRLTDNYRLPNDQDWARIFEPAQTYQFAQSVHYWLILGIALFASAGAVAQVFSEMVQQPERIMNGLLALSIVVVLAFWIALWQGMEARLEPLIFRQLGPFGVGTFTHAIQALRTNASFWKSMTLFQKALTSNSMFGVVCGVAVVGGVLTIAVAAGAGAGFNAWWAMAEVVAMAGLTAMTGANTGSWWDRASWAIAMVAVLVIGFWADAADNIAWIGAWAMAWVVASVVAMVGASLSGYGAALLSEIYTLQGKQHSSIPGWKKGVAFFAFPYFCWFPITAIFSFLGLRNLLHSLNWGNWGLAAVIWLSLFSFCSGLWVYGQRKERVASNPLQGILDEDYPQYLPRSNQRRRRKKL
ncbi:NACHT domain-containing protein [Halomicronema hongdechloris]|nr:NACHT domain-containing protein [Halomicronema hongdechloris]